MCHNSISTGVLMFALLFFANDVAAQQSKTTGVPISAVLEREIFVEASALSGYAIPEQLPEIRFVSHRFIVAETCDGIECNRYAAAAPHMPIWVDETLDLTQAGDRSFVLHEVIHVLQFAAKGITDVALLSCAEVLQLEKEAYHLQQKYLDKEKSWLRVTWGIDRMSCPEVPEKVH